MLICPDVRLYTKKRGQLSCYPFRGSSKTQWRITTRAHAKLLYYVSIYNMRERSVVIIPPFLNLLDSETR